MEQSIDTEIVDTNDLPYTNDVVPLNEDDQSCIEEIRHVLKKHGALDRFGITLLHKHFDIDDGEVMVERTDEAAKVQTIRPYKKTELDACIGQTAWRLSDQSAVMGCYMVCIREASGWRHAHVTSGS